MIFSPPLRNPSSSFCLEHVFAEQCVSQDTKKKTMEMMMGINKKMIMMIKKKMTMAIYEKKIMISFVFFDDRE